MVVSQEYSENFEVAVEEREVKSSDAQYCSYKTVWRGKVRGRDITA
jgi:hypothetical protein